MTSTRDLIVARLEGRQAYWHGLTYHLRDKDPEWIKAFLEGWHEAEEMDKDEDLQAP